MLRTSLPQSIQEIVQSIDRWPIWQVFFPRLTGNKEKYPLLTKVGIFVVVTLLSSLLGFFFRPGGMIGFDWITFWSTKITPPHYPPWTAWFLPLLNWNLLLGITIGGFTVLVMSRHKYLSSAVLSYFCLPFFWILLLGQIDGVAAAGLIALPLTIPIALIKPLITLFALFSKRSIFIYTVLFILISFLIFGFWPSSMINVETYQAYNRAEQNIGLGGWWTILALIGLWFSRGDMDMMMLAGIVAIPYLIPYHLFPTVPAVSRLKPWAAAVAALFSWLPLSANWIGPTGWWLGWVYVAWVWGNLAAQRYPDFFSFRPIYSLFARQPQWTKKAT